MYIWCGICYNIVRMEYSAIIVAAGAGRRTMLRYNKVFFELSEGATILDSCLSVFMKDEDCRQIVLVCAKDELDIMMQEYGYVPNITICIGGSTRQESVSLGLNKAICPHVFIHDGARPYLKSSLVQQLKETLEKEDACLLMVPTVDTPKIVDDGYVTETIQRDRVYRAQTPQCFKTELIRQCHQQAQEQGFVATDDAQLVERFSQVPIKVVLGDEDNIKITLPQDLPK